MKGENDSHKTLESDENPEHLEGYNSSFDEESIIGVDTTNNKEEKSSKSANKKKLILFIIGVCFLIITLGIGLYLGLKNNNSKNNNSNNNSTSSISRNINVAQQQQQQSDSTNTNVTDLIEDSTTSTTNTSVTISTLSNNTSEESKTNSTNTTNNTTNSTNSKNDDEDKIIDTTTKRQWPELVDTNSTYAKSIIIKERSDIKTIQIISDEDFVTMDYVTSRVRIFINVKKDIVTQIPRIG